MTNQMELLNKVLYPVELKKSKEEGYQNIVRSDTGEMISEVSDRYTLVPNQDLFMPFIKHFGEQSLVSCVPKTRACTVEIETGRSFDFGKGDLIRERLVIQNSYDRTRSYKFMFGCFRLVCSNGLYIGQVSVQYRKIHIGTIPVEEMIKGVLKDYKSNKFDLWRQMAKVATPVKKQVEVINRLKCLEIADDDRDADSQYRNYAINEKIKTRAIEFVNRPESVDNIKNCWGLLNQINRSIAHELRGSYMLEKRILANTLTTEYLTKTFKLN